MTASRFSLTVTGLSVLIFAGVFAWPCVVEVQAQTLQQRIDNVRHQRRQTAAKQQDAQRRNALHLKQRLSEQMGAVQFDDVSAKAAFQRWAKDSKVPLVINWEAMKQAGVDPDAELSLQLQNVPAYRVLRILMQQAAPNADLIFEQTPWYVQVKTKREANQTNVLRIYQIGDVITKIPTFDSSPSFDLNSALSNTNSGGSGSTDGGGGSNETIFPDNDETDKEPAPTKRERAQTLVGVIQDTVEPELWASGTGASMRYFDGRLIVSAPKYVQRQIGTATGFRPSARGGVHSSANRPAHANHGRRSQRRGDSASRRSRARRRGSISSTSRSSGVSSVEGR